MAFTVKSFTWVRCMSLQIGCQNRMTNNHAAVRAISHHWIVSCDHCFISHPTCKANRAFGATPLLVMVNFLPW